MADRLADGADTELNQAIAPCSFKNPWLPILLRAAVLFRNSGFVGCERIPMHPVLVRAWEVDNIGSRSD